MCFISIPVVLAVLAENPPCLWVFLAQGRGSNVIFNHGIDEKLQTISELVFVGSTMMGFCHFALVFQGLGALWENDTSC